MADAPDAPGLTPTTRRGGRRAGVGRVLAQAVLALGVLVGGAAMTAAWVALFFSSPTEPDPAAAPAEAGPAAHSASHPDHRPEPSAGVPRRRLLWLVLDAMRADAAFDARLMPALARLRREGTWGIARTGTFTMTGTCVRALGTGAEPRPTHVLHNFRSPRPRCWGRGSPQC